MFIKPMIPIESMTNQISPVNKIENQPTNSFTDVLKDAMNNVTKLQESAEAATEQLALGQVDDIHSIMIQTERAALALELTVQVTSKAVSAYNEIMRMQM
jgi:flagellar hook-basal body complex protein FliE